MFGFLKDKLNQAVKKFSKKAEEDVTEEKVEDKQQLEQAKQEEVKLKERAAPKPKPPKEVPKEPEQTKEQPPEEKPEEKPEPPEQPKETPSIEVPEEPGRVEDVSPDEPEQHDTVEEIKPAPKEEPPKEKPKEEKEPEKPGFFEKLLGKKEAPKQPEKETRTVITRFKDTFTKKTLSSEKFDELFWNLELTLLENNVAIEVIEKIKADLKDELTSGKVNRLGVEDMILARLQQSINELFEVEPFNLVERIKQTEKPYKICVIGVNGSGKTTTLAKLVQLFKDNGLTSVVAASDTFRAAAIDQLKAHTEKLGVKLISQGYGSDPAAVAFDAVKHAKANKVDVVLIDTAGRLHSNTNLMSELDKVVRVSQPDLKLFVGESITGNDCVEQAKEFDSLVGIDGIILSKADVDEKGGAAISVSYITKKPILYIGTGQTYADLEPFDKEKIIASVGL